MTVHDVVELRCVEHALFEEARKPVEIPRTPDLEANRREMFGSEDMRRHNNSRFNVRLLLDRSSPEVFAQNGETVITELIFPRAGVRKLRLSSEGTAPSVEGITIHRLK